MNKVYLLILDWALDGENGYSISVFDTLENAKQAFSKMVKKEKVYAENNGFDTIDTDTDTEYTAFIDGEYCVNHIDLSITEYDVLSNDN